MSKRVDVLLAVKALVAAALPGTVVLGLDDGEDALARVTEAGRAIVRSGDPGEPEVDLGVLTYWYEHRIPIELATYRGTAESSEEALDTMLMPIGAAVEADRTLGGLCIWLEAQAPSTENMESRAGDVASFKPARAADLILVASYGTTSPLA